MLPLKKDEAPAIDTKESEIFPPVKLSAKEIVKFLEVNLLAISFSIDSSSS